MITDNLSTDKVPTLVSDLVTTITAGKTTPYDKARALSTYFTDPANGFVYSLQTKSGESGNDLVDFLTTGKAGFCQQYAAALGVMLRVAGIPARVVLGYTHPAPDATGKFVVTSDDAHAWVEAYFAGIGWMPFDPTPLTGADAARAVALPWAPHPRRPLAPMTGRERPGPTRRPPPPTRPTRADHDDDATTTSRDSAGRGLSGGRSRDRAGCADRGAVARLLRFRRRRQRLRPRPRRGPEPLWEELADTTRDLGLGWSDARTTRQVTVWLGELLPGDQRGGPRSALRPLADAVERERYSAVDPHAESTGRTRSSWRQASMSSRTCGQTCCSSVSPRTRWRARLLPASLRRGDRMRPHLKIGAGPREALLGAVD